MVLSEERTMNRGCKPGSKERGLGFCFFLWTVLGLSCELQAQLPHSMWDLPSVTRDQTCVHHIGRQILNCWTTRDSPRISFKVRFPSVKHPLQMKTFFFFFNTELYCGGDRAEAHCFYAQSKSYKQKKCWTHNPKFWLENVTSCVLLGLSFGCPETHSPYSVQSYAPDWRMSRLPIFFSILLSNY